MRFKILLLSALFSVNFHSFSQNSLQLENSFEAGIHLGVASFQTDYGERGDFKSGVTGNIGFAIGAAFYMNFFSRQYEWNAKSDWLADHIKLKGEFSYLRADLEHFIEGDSPTAIQLQAMHGSSSVVNLGAIVEYHFLNLTSFGSSYGNTYSPFVGLGAMMNFSKPTFESSLGDYLTDPSILPLKYRSNAIYTDPETVFSVLMSVGTRINVGRTSDIVIDSRWQYFTSNKIDGLDPKDDANKY
ncbi:MAG TPA: hypothetical protein ENK75_03520, partial [Saprospiraceae bacterium]|nr:hypothetical protein [Saprospiraceae bacterium]